MDTDSADQLSAVADSGSVTHSTATDSRCGHNPASSHDNTLSSPYHSTQSHDHPSPVTTTPLEGSPKLHNLDTVTENTPSKLYEDAIGDTVFSKAWVLSILVEIIEMVREESDGPLDPQESNRDKLASSGAVDKMNCSGEAVGAEDVEGEISEGVESDGGENVTSEGEEESVEEVEGRLCTLWDASMNAAVAEFIHKQGGIELLLGAAQRSSKPRLTEICLGIIGNMLCCREICLVSFERPEERRIIFQFYQETDHGILCQIIRLTQTFLTFEELQQTWLQEVIEVEIVREALLFILQCSTSDELLASASSLLELLLNLSDQLLVEWVDGQLVVALCEAARQTRYTHFEVTCTVIAALHTLTSVEEGTAYVLSCDEEVSLILCEFFGTVDQLEDLSTCFTALTAACSLQLTLLDSQTAKDKGSVFKVLKRLKEKICSSPQTQLLLKLIANVLDSMHNDTEKVSK